MRTYTELSKLKTFKERYEYLKLGGKIGEETFGYDRYLNQTFYRSNKWRRIRDQVIIRDNGCDLGIDGREIYGQIIIHHINPISQQDVVDQTDLLTNIEFLICTTHLTHNAIHYGDETLLIDLPIERTLYDTCPWRKT